VGTYRHRIIDTELDALMTGLPAIALEGPKGVGKTATAARRARTVYRLDLPASRELLEAAPEQLHAAPGPVLLDEWQRWPQSWDLVHRAVDDGAPPGRFLLTGSAIPTEAPVHSGAGRIVTLRMRPLSLAERDLTRPTVSLAELLNGTHPDVEGRSDVGLADYLDAVTASGFPGFSGATPRAARAQIDGYLERIVQRDLEEQGVRVRRQDALRGWLIAYAAATSTTTSYTALLDAATPGDAEKPARSTIEGYRSALQALWLLDPVPGWAPSLNPLKRVAQAPKHHLADPALAASLLGVGVDALLRGRDAGPPALRDGDLAGRLFESLVVLSVRTYAQAAEARVTHFRTRNGDHEVDMIVGRADGRVLAIEVKIAPSVSDDDVRHLRWLGERYGNDLLDAVVITAGRDAYRRRDGIAVIPAALLGP
jgi:uncharacterized protein